MHFSPNHTEHFMICQVEIVDNLLKEEKQMKKRYQQQPQLWPEKQRDRVKVIVMCHYYC